MYKVSHLRRDETAPKVGHPLLFLLGGMDEMGQVVRADWLWLASNRD